VQVEKERLAKLRYQLNPHFLFNSLTSICGAILVDRQVAREMVSDLADLLRRSLASGDEDHTTVREELETLNLFLRIERRRMGEDLEIEVRSDETVVGDRIPTLFLQPLAENAIKHGRKTSGRQPLAVRVAVERGGADRLCVRVSNTGRWIEPEASSDRSNGRGLAILRERLDRLYPGQHTFATREQEGWVQVEVCLPRAAEPD
jgi:LytS/YehU family sensor histidine kinase